MHFSFVCPCAIVQRIANGVVGDGVAIKLRQLVLPVGIVVLIQLCNDVKIRFAGRVGIGGLAQDIATPVVGVDPSGTSSTDSCIVGIVDPNELSMCVILVGSGYAVPSLAGNVAPGCRRCT